MSEALEAALKKPGDIGQPEVAREIIAGRIIAAAELRERAPLACWKHRSKNHGTFPSASGSHSVAADSRRNQVYAPVRGNLGTTPVSTTTICSTAKDASGNAGSNNFGCIAIYTAPHDDRR